MVKNPYNGKLINILPLFELMNECKFEMEGGVENIVKTIQEIHDFVSSQVNLDDGSTIKSQFQAYKSVNYALVDLRKTFERMQEFKA